ncbi:MAG: exodeoxyribonuclease VII large subunit, partial [Terracidiphilus sp.]
LHASQSLADSSIARAESRIAALLHRLAQRLDDLVFRQESALSAQLRQRQNRVAALAAAVLRHDPRQSIAQARETLLALRARLDRSLERLLRSSALTLSSLDARVHSLSPLAVLDRGYALILSSDGALIRSMAQVSHGDQVTTRLADGTFTSRVVATQRKKVRAATQKRPEDSE